MLDLEELTAKNSELEKQLLELKRKETVLRKLASAVEHSPISVLITDHQVRETLNIVDRGYIIHEGRVIAEGPRDYLINDAKAREFYLGKDFNL